MEPTRQKYSFAVFSAKECSYKTVVLYNSLLFRGKTAENRETTLFRGFSKIAKEHYLPHTDRERTGWTVARLLDFFGKLYTV